MKHALTWIGAACAAVLAAVPAVAAAGGQSWSYYAVGNEEDVETATRGLLVLQGGGDDVDENYVRMGAFGGGGDFVVLRASQAGEYNEYIFQRCDCDSVQTIVFHDREAAFDPTVIEVIRDAEALFIAGGDQSRYVRFWKDTPVQAAIAHVAAKPAPVGGTSAGMAVLGEFVYSALGEASLTAQAALGDPFHPDLTLEADLLKLPLLDDLITDQHLQERDRMGRTVAMMARMLEDGLTTRARAIAADRETALHIDPATGAAQVFATADHETPYVYMMRATVPPATCVAGEPLTFDGVEVRRLGPGDSFDMETWDSQDGIAYTLRTQGGTLYSSRGSVY